MPYVLLSQSVLSVVMFSVIWLVQVLVYPQFRNVGFEDLSIYSQAHAVAISWVVAPVMLLEALTLLWLWKEPSYRNGWLIIASLLLFVIWVQTFFQMVPIHEQLQTEPSRLLVDRLIRCNSWRTLAWTLKLMFVFGLWLVMSTRAQLLEKGAYIEISHPLHKPNGVSTFVSQTDRSYIAPIEVSDNTVNIWGALEHFWQEQGQTFEVLKQDSNERVYMLVSRWWGFPDLMRLRMQDSKIVGRSQAVLGYSDLGYNRNVWESARVYLADKR